MLRFGPDGGPVVIAALPLFEEANRTRAFLVAVLRALAAHGIGGVLPDFPGTGDSLVATRDAALGAMRTAHAALAERLDGRVFAVGIRSGALLDADAPVDGRWHLAAQTGDEVLHDLWRIRRIGAGSRDRFDPTAMIDADADHGDYAGNLLSRDMLAGLLGAAPSDTACRTVRLETDPRPADLKLLGTPLWKRSEPGNDRWLADRLADDIAQWIAACAG